MFEELKPHLEELRKRLVICAVSVVICFFVAFAFWEPILSFMTSPLRRVLPEGSDMIFTAIPETFFTAMKVSFFASLLVSMPIIFWQGWLFVAPGLYDNEKRYVIPFVVSASAMFLLGASFAYFVAIPVAYQFLINFGGELFKAMPRIGEYVGFFTKLVIAFGISFELPVVTFFTAKLGLVTDRALIGFFRYAVVAIFIFAAVMTPPDVLSQFLLAIPLIGLYGVSILVAKAINPAAKNEEKSEKDNINSDKNLDINKDEISGEKKAKNE